MRLFLLAIMSVFMITACNSGDPKVKSSPSASADEGEQMIRNDITLNSAGLKVKQAFLVFDDGKLVPADNKIEIGQKVNMRLIVEGWKDVDGKVKLGASEKITTDGGEIVLDEADLFASLPEGVNAEDAKFIRLSATITQLVQLVKYFEVSFRVWDKNSKDEITGSYRLYLK